MKYSVQDYRKWLEKQKTKKEDLERRMQLTREAIEAKQAEGAELVKAKWVISEVSRLTQERFKKYVEDLVTMAIRSVLDQPLKFLVNFEIKRNKSECYLRVRDGDNEPYIPKDEQGGILVDLIGFALRVVLWSLQRPRSRNVFILDEPFHYIGKGEPLHKAGQMLRELSQPPPKGLGVQFIIVTHEPELGKAGDRSWEVWHDGVRSEVKQVTNNGKSEIGDAGLVEWSKSYADEIQIKARKELEL